MNQYCEHHKIYDDSKTECYFFTLSVPNISLINNLHTNTSSYKMKNGYYYYGTLDISKDKITFQIASACSLKCSVSIFIGSKTLLLSNSVIAPSRIDDYNRYYDLVTLTSRDETFQKLKEHPNNTLVLNCRLIYQPNFLIKYEKPPVNPSLNSLHNLKTLAAAFKNSSEPLSKDTVLLRIGDETEMVSKTVICAGSPVFAKMFENDMKELKEKTVIITDITMPVLKVLLDFFYTGKLSICDSDSASNCDLEFLFDLYYAADKYDIAIVRQHCIDLLLPKISSDNVIGIWKFAFSHDDSLLKTSAIAFIATNFEKWLSTNEWKNLVNEEPMIAAEVLNFLDI